MNYKEILQTLVVFERLYAVTKSIKLVAFTKFKKVQSRIKEKNIGISIFSNILTQISISSKIFNNILLIPIFSDKGCCGPINIQLISELTNSVHFLIQLKKKLYVILIGKRGINYIRKNFPQLYKFSVTKLFNNFLSFYSTINIVEFINKKKYDLFIFFFNHFISINEQRVYSYFIPSFSLLFQMHEWSINNLLLNYIFFKTKENKNVLIDYHNFFMYVLLLKALKDHELSELGGRISSMEQASQNALQLSEKLRIEYNKARQSYITNQLIEIVSAIAAINVKFN